MQLLINSGADVSTRDNGHSTPLHLVSSSGSDEAMRLLIKHGANVNAEDIRGRTPLETLPCRPAPSEDIAVSVMRSLNVKQLLEYRM